MSQIAYQANLASGFYPFLSRYQGQTVISVGKDQAFRQTAIIGESDKDDNKGVPQLYYCHNAIPTVQGIQSIGYTQKLAGLVGVTNFNGIFLLKDPEENKFLFSPSGGFNYIYNANNTAWQSVSPIISYPTNADITIAYLNGQTYIYFARIGCYKYNRITNLLEPVTLIGINPTLINGICESSGFLLLYDDFTIYRSQVINQLDFTPDPALGSGSSIPEGLQGKIVCCLKINDGFIIYTTANIVSASFSQNIRFPFTYNEVDGSAGLVHQSQVAWINNTGVHYAWTKVGLQLINKNKATMIHPDVTDFLTSKIFEDFDETTNTFTTTKLTSLLNISIAIVGKRFLVISYGITELTHALVFDLSIKRWGKYKITHVAAFEYFIPNLSGEITWEMLGELTWENLGESTWEDFTSQIETVEQPKDTLAFLLKDGTITTVQMDQIGTNHSGVAVFGKYQYIRERLLQLDDIEVENIDQDMANFTLVLLSSTNGKVIDQITTPFLSENADTYRKYNSTVNAKNHTLAFKGTFCLSSMQLKFNQVGRM